MLKHKKSIVGGRRLNYANLIKITDELAIKK